MGEVMHLERLQALIEPTITGLDCELVGCEILGRGGENLLRIYVDSEAGVTLETCERVSRQVSAVLDVEDPIRGRYVLEVSSPGSDRPLFKLAHYQRFIGRKIKLRLRIAEQEQRNFKGELSAVEGEQIVLKTDEKTCRFAFANIEKANLVPEF